MIWGRPLLPSGTARDGRVRPNSSNTGEGQGRGGHKLILHCKQCGFPFDKTRTRTHSGTYSGNGAQGQITDHDDSYTDSWGATRTAEYGSATYRKGAGCPLCHSADGAA